MLTADRWDEVMEMSGCTASRLLENSLHEHKQNFAKSNPLMLNTSHPQVGIADRHFHAGG